MRFFILSLLAGIFSIAQCMTYNDGKIVSIPEDKRHVLYKIDGVEYVDTTNRKTTMKFILEESFFTNI